MSIRPFPWPLTAHPPGVQTVPMADLSPRLASLRDELHTTTATLHRIADPLEDAAWKRRPAENRWSVAECIEHLNMSSRALIPRIRDAAREGRARGLTHPSQRLDVMGWFLVRSLEPPAKSRFKTSESFIPPSIEPKATVVAAHENLQAELIALLPELDGLSLAKIKITSPFSSRVKYNAWSALCVTAAHQRRHLWQAEQVLATFGRGAR
jgi:hypothetical protein